MTLDKMSGKIDDGSNQVPIIEGMVKFRDGRKWKSRWCVMRKLSPVADCIHLQLYRDAKERQKNGQTKSSLSLQQYLGMECGFTLDKESNTLALVCRDVTAVLAFPAHEALLQWRVRATRQLGEARTFPALVALAPSRSRVPRGPVRVHVRHVPALPSTVCLTSGAPPKLLAVWDVADLRRYGLVEGRLCFEVGARGGRLEGAWSLIADKAEKLVEALASSSSTSWSSIGNENRKQLQLKIDKRLSDMNDSIDMDMTPSWNMDQMSEADSSIGFGDSASVIDVHISKHGSNESRESLRPTNLGRCMSCMSHLGAPTAGSAASTTSGAWPTMDSFNEMRPETDRASLYSRSSGGTSEYSVPKTFWKDCNMSSKSVSPVCSLPPGSIAQARSTCTCLCLRSQKSFSGPYENYDVPKPPMPLIQEYPTSSPSMRKSNSNYDVPKNLKKCLTKDVRSCSCLHNNVIKRSLSFTPTIEHTREDVDSLLSQLDLHIEPEASSSHSNYANIEPIPESVTKETIQEQLSEDLSLCLDEFESSAQILRNAGFCLDELEDIPENELLSMNQEHQNYSSRDSKDTKMSLTVNNFSPKRSVVVRRESSFAENSTLTRRKSSSADFLKKAEEFFDMAKSSSHKDVSKDLNPLTKNTYSNDMLENFINQNHQTVIRKTDCSTKPEKPNKPDNTFLSKFRDSVKIRRSSSAPSKSEKNRDSSSSSDSGVSGVSTGSLKCQKYDIGDVELPVLKHACQKKVNRKTIDYSPMSITSTTSDPMQQISFKFHEVPNMVKSESFDAGPMSCIRRHNKGLTSLDGRGVRSPSSCGSETSDYLETLSMSSMSSNETSSRCITRPRSGREYSTIQNTLRRQNTCDRCCHLPQEI